MLSRHSLIHEDMRHFFDGYPSTAHPMAILSAMVTSLSTFYPEALDPSDDVEMTSLRLLSKLRTLAAYAYKRGIGQPITYPKNSLSYCGNFLHMMFATPAEPYEVDPVMERALNLLLILHADHEQNCSTSTVRLAGSSEVNQFAAISRLTPDYLASTGIISNHTRFEGMALFRHPNGTYYIVTSHLTGWGPNPLMLFRAAGKTLDDPQWVDMGNPTGDEVSFNSQPTYVVQYTPQAGDPYFVYM